MNSPFCPLNRRARTSPYLPEGYITTMRSLLSILALSSLAFAGPGAVHRPESAGLGTRQSNAYPPNTIDQPIDHFPSDPR